jgi:hypothetical protein
MKPKIMTKFAYENLLKCGVDFSEEGKVILYYGVTVSDVANKQKVEALIKTEGYNVDSLLLVPLYAHDCTGCTYMGVGGPANGRYDMYHHEHEGILVRFSSDGPDYSYVSFDHIQAWGLHQNDPRLLAALGWYYLGGFNVEGVS